MFDDLNCLISNYYIVYCSEDYIELYVYYCNNECYFILGYCLVGYFGVGCVENCNIMCDGCNIVNGLCDSGCYLGWKGLNWEESNVFVWMKINWYEKKMNIIGFLYIYLI